MPGDGTPFLARSSHSVAAVGGESRDVVALAAHLARGRLVVVVKTLLGPSG